MLVPRDITNKQFGKATFGGYKAEEVNMFLAEIAEDYSRLMNENKDLERQLSKAMGEVEEYRQEQDSLSVVLVGAQKMADSIVREAQGHAELIQRDAEIRADKLLEGTQRQLEEEKSEYARLKDEVGNFRSTILGMYKTHLELVTALPTFADPTPIGSGVQAPPARPISAVEREEDIQGGKRPETTATPMENTEEREAIRRRKGFVPNLDGTSSGSGFSFKQETFEDTQIEQNEILDDPNQESLYASQEIYTQMDETNMLDVEGSAEFQEINENKRPVSKFGKLQFGQEYQITRDDESHTKKKRRR